MVTTDATKATPAPVRHRPWLLPLAMAALVALCIAVLALGLPPKLRAQALRDGAAAEALGPPRVHTALAKAAPSASEVVLPGTAEAQLTAQIYARTSGFVQKYLVDIGDRVKEGQTLAILDTPEVEAEAASARARQSEFEQNQKLSKATAERYRRLAQAGVTSEDQADQYEAQANSIAASLDTSRGDTARVHTVLGFRYIKAPFEGVITRRNVEQGSLVTAGSGAGVTSLFEVAKVDKLKVMVSVPQSLAALVRVGDKAKVRGDLGEVEGTIARTSGALDRASRTLRVEVELPPNDQILPGAFVRVALPIQTPKPPVLVPANALAPRAEGLFVFTVDDAERVVPRRVELGRELGVEAELAGGLSPGERVILHPRDSLSAGLVVQIVNEPESPPSPSTPSTPSTGAAKGAK